MIFSLLQRCALREMQSTVATLHDELSRLGGLRGLRALLFTEITLDEKPHDGTEGEIGQQTDEAHAVVLPKQESLADNNAPWMTEASGPPSTIHAVKMVPGAS
jgi:hypothetical protein